MDILKKLFGEEALTFEQLSEKLADNKEIKLANLVEGNYVSKDKFLAAETKANELSAQLETRDEDLDKLKASAGDNEELTTKLDTLKESYSTLESDTAKKLKEVTLASAVDLAIASARPVDENAQRSIKALIDQSILKIEDENLVGIKEQLEKIETDSKYFFENGKKADDDTPPVNPTGDDDEPFDFEKATDQEVHEYRTEQRKGK